MMMMTKEEKGRRYIAEFLAAMDYHDPDLQNTIKTMQNKLLQIQQNQFKKPIRKIIIKFGGGTEPAVLHKRPHSETLVHDAVEKDSRNASSKRQKTTMIKKTSINNNVSPTNPNSSDQNALDFIKSVGGSQAELVVEKRLTVSDVSGNLGRLLIPVLQVKNPGFLTGEEKLVLGNKQNVSVFVFDPERRKVALNLGKWKMSKEYYVLKTNWNQVVCANGFKEEMVIRVLSFRDVQHKLCFAIDRVA